MATPIPATSAAVAPGPQISLLGALTGMRGDVLQSYVEATQRYGDVVRFQVGPTLMHLLAHPDHVKYVLVDNEKNYWKGKGFRKVWLALGEGLFTSDGPALMRLEPH